MRLGGPQGRIATRSIPNVFRAQQQPPAFVSRLGQVQVARREIVVEVLPDATTGQINHMLASVQGGIVASAEGRKAPAGRHPRPANSPRAERDRQAHLPNSGGCVRAGER